MAIESDHHLSQLDRLLSVWEGLGQGERDILMVFMMRLKNGQRRYGPIDVNKKDWPYEALEEMVDGCVYLSCALWQKANKAYDASLKDAEHDVHEAGNLDATSKEHFFAPDNWDANDTTYACNPRF